MAYRVTNELEAEADESSKVGIQDGAGATTSTKTTPTTQAAAAPSVSSTLAGAASGTAGSRKMDEDEERDAVFFRLETSGIPCRGRV